MFRPGPGCRPLTSFHRHLVSQHRSFITGIAAQNYYKDLGLDSDAGSNEIKKAYFDLTKKYHPDVNPDDPEALKRFHAISQAYRVLGDPRQRRMYDRGSLAKAGVADEEAIKHSFEGEDFFKSRSDFKEKYSSGDAPDHSDIQSKRMSNLNRRMDDWVMNARREAFHDSRANKRFKKKIDDMRNRPDPKTPRQARVRSPYMDDTRPANGGGGGGSSILAAFVIILTLLILNRLGGGG